jgi:hypothetical protein
MVSSTNVSIGTTSTSDSTTKECSWEPLFNDVWVARVDECFVGMIQRVGSLFKLTDAAGHLIGQFQSIYDARNALVAR